MDKNDLVDLLRSLSIIEGAVCTADISVQNRVGDELEWCVSKIVKELKQEKKNEKI
jgi:hypothetical protein